MGEFHKMNAKRIVKSNAIWLVFILEVVFFALASGGAFIRTNNIVNISNSLMRRFFLLCLL